MLKNLKTILFSLIIISGMFYAVSIVYKQIQLNNEYIAKEQKETEKLIEQTQDYRSKIKSQIEAVEKDVDNLKLEYTQAFGFNFNKTEDDYAPSLSSNGDSGRADRIFDSYRRSSSELKQHETEFTEAEKDYLKCLTSLQYSEWSTKEKQVACYEMVKVYHPNADLRSILFVIGFTN